MNIVLFEPSEVRPDGRVDVSGPRARHMLKVLKVARGQAVRVGVIDGPLGTGIVTEIADAQIELQCVFEPVVPERPRVDLLLAVPRPKVLRRLWAQLAALGIGQVILTNAEKVERDYFDSHVMHESGYRPLLVEGLQQARDTRVPLVSIHKQFRVLVEDELDRLFPTGPRLVAHPGGDGSIPAALTAPRADRVLIAIGPEGGWNDFEIRLLSQQGFESVSTGPRILTTTTACIAALTLAHAGLS